VKNKQFFATLIVGAMFGASVLLTIRGHDLDLLYLRLVECRTQCQQLEEDKQKLEQELTHAEKQRNRVLKKVNIVVSTAPDEFTRLAVQKEVRPKFNSLLGKDLTLLESQPELFEQMLENRVLRFPSQSVTLDVTSVVIGETTTIYLHAKKEEATLKQIERGDNLLR
jgi:hypothetical protein